MILSEYTPAWTTTLGIALFCAAAMAWLIAVYCADPSRATVTALELGAADGTDEDDDGDEDERLEATLEDDVAEVVDEDVGAADDAELDVDATVNAELVDEIVEEPDASLD